MNRSEVSANPGEQTVQFRKKDAERIAAAVYAHERGRRPGNPSKLPRASGGGGGGGIRLAQFSGQWRNEAPNNLKIVQLFTRRASPLPGQSAVSPFDWVPETDSSGNAVTAVAINWMAHVPSTPGDTIRWCAVAKISELGGSYDTGIKTVDPNNPGQQIAVTEEFDGLWLLIAAEC